MERGVDKGGLEISDFTVELVAGYPTDGYGVRMGSPSRGTWIELWWAFADLELRLRGMAAVPGVGEAYDAQEARVRIEVWRDAEVFLATRRWNGEPEVVMRVARRRYLTEWERLIRFTREHLLSCTSLEEALDHRSTVTHVEVGHQSLERIPEEIGECAKLEVLQVKQNRLEDLPKGLAKCVRLRWIDASANRLVSLPDLGRAEQLEGLELGENCLDAIPAWVTGLRRLRVCRLDGNPVSRCLKKELAARRPDVEIDAEFGPHSTLGEGARLEDIEAAMKGKRSNPLVSPGDEG